MELALALRVVIIMQAAMDWINLDGCRKVIRLLFKRRTHGRIAILRIDSRTLVRPVQPHRLVVRSIDDRTGKLLFLGLVLFYN